MNMKNIFLTLFMVTNLFAYCNQLFSQDLNDNDTITKLNANKSEVVIIRIAEHNTQYDHSKKRFDLYIVSPESNYETKVTTYNHKKNDPSGDMLEILSQELLYWIQKGFKIETSFVFTVNLIPFGKGEDAELTTIILVR